jgi:DNA modification methylase
MIDVSTSSHHVGDCRRLLKQLPTGCVQTCITSPPYWGLRDYGHEGQIGLEATPELFVAELVAVFREVRRVLADDGTLWVNLGDSYITKPRGPGGAASSTLTGTSNSERRQRRWEQTDPKKSPREARAMRASAHGALKNKDLVGIPWMTAFALRADGWYLRSEIIWSKPSPMPESVIDRPTKAHEHIFLLSKQERYLYEVDAIREPLSPHTHSTYGTTRKRVEVDGVGRVASHGPSRDVPERKPKLDGNGEILGGNKRSVWTVATQPYDGAHFATFPPKLIEPCVLAGSRVGDLVLDPFFGSGTTGQVAEKHGRRWVGFDLGYAELAAARTAQRSLVLP